MDAERLYERVGQRLQVGRDEAVRVCDAILMALHLRLREPAARQVEALLPAELRPLWAHGGEALKERRGALSDFSRSQFIHYVGDRLDTPDYHQAEAMIRAVFGTLREELPAADPIVRAEVPEDIRELWAGVATQAQA